MTHCTPAHLRSATSGLDHDGSIPDDSRKRRESRSPSVASPPTNGKGSLHTALRMLSCPSRPVFADTGGDGRYSKDNPMTNHARVLQKRYRIQHADLERRQPFIVTPW